MNHHLANLKRALSFSALVLFLFSVEANAQATPGVNDLPPASGADAGASDGAETSPSQDALSDTSWFDAEKRSLIPVEVESEAKDSLNRDSRWLPKADRVRQADTPANTTGGTGFWGTGLSIGNLLGWFLLTLLIVTTVVAISLAVSRSDFDFSAGPASRVVRRTASADEQMLERMKHLPEELRRTDVNLRSEAERLMKQSSYDQAVILLFAHQLLLLDHAGLLRLNRGKTNRRYVREARSVDRESANRLASTATAFERSYFGGHSITRNEFMVLWQDNLAIEEAMSKRQEAAA